MFQLIKDSVTELTNPPSIYFASIIASPNDIHADDTRSEVSKLVHNFADNTVKVL
jgi:hypothetical protein